MDKCILLRLAYVYDRDLLLEWANDKDLRINSFNQGEISSETHEKWLHKILNSGNIKLFIMMHEKIPVGQIRLEIVENSGILSYSIAEKYRGFGYGKIILQLLEEWIADHYDIEFEIIGLVKKENDVSKHLFETANYEKTENNQYIKYLKLISPKY